MSTVDDVVLCRRFTAASMLLSTVKAAADIAKTAAPAAKALPYIGPVVTIIDNIITVINADGDICAAFAADGAVPKELELLKVMISDAASVTPSGRRSMPIEQYRFMTLHCGQVVADCCV
jgi:hypothetical protein